MRPLAAINERPRIASAVDPAAAMIHEKDTVTKPSPPAPHQQNSGCADSSGTLSSALCASGTKHDSGPTSLFEALDSGISTSSIGGNVAACSNGLKLRSSSTPEVDALEDEQDPRVTMATTPTRAPHRSRASCFSPSPERSQLLATN